jgi:hypothetical protein
MASYPARISIISVHFWNTESASSVSNAGFLKLLKKFMDAAMRSRSSFAN